MSVVFDHGVEDDQQLSHAGGEGDFGFFPLGLEPGIEGFEYGVMASGDEGGHVERRPESGSAAPDASLAAELSTIVIQGSDSHQGGDLLTVELTELGQFGDECGGGHFADARNTFEKLVALVPVIVGFDELEDLPVDPFEVFVNGVDEVLNAVQDLFVDGQRPAIEFRGAMLDELSSPGGQFVELSLLFMGLSDRARLDVLGKPCDDEGVDAVGLGEQTERFGIVADLRWIDDRDGIAGGGQIADEGLLVASGGLNDDQTGSGAGKFLEEEGALAGRVVAAEDWTVENVNIEVVLRDVDADKRGDGSHVEEIPTLQMRARCASRRAAQAAVRAGFNNPATILLTHGLRCPRGYRSVAGRPGGACFATLRSPRQGVFHLTNR